MKKIKPLSFALIASFSICLTPMLISCGNKINDEISLNDFVNSLNPTIKPEKKSEQTQVLASTIKTESDLQSWFNNLPESKNGIIATFSYTSADDKKGSLEICYILAKNGNEIKYTNTYEGFKIREKEPDQLDVENFIKTLKDPTIKENKKSELPNTLADSIKTEEQVKEWFDGLWNSDSQKGINVSFIKTESNSNNSSIPKGTLRVYYQIQKGEYFTQVYWETPGFQNITNPINPPATGNTKYKVSFKRSNGKALQDYNSTINIYKNDNPNLLYKDIWMTNSINEFELPTGTYKCVIQSNPPNGMEVNKEFIISEQNPSYDIVFRPKDLQNTPTPEGYNYKINDVLFQSEYTDVNNNTYKLSDNIKNKKITLFFFFKIDCPYCNAMEKEIAQWKEEDAIKDRFEVWLFSGHDSKTRLVDWSKGYKNFRVFEDTNFIVRKHFDDTQNPQKGVPQFYFVDQEGVLVSKSRGQTSNLKDKLLELID